MQKLVVLIDDDRLPMQYYLRAMKQRGFDVRQFTEPDGALDFLHQKGNEISIIIMDIMMSSGKAYASEDTDEGLKTGVFLLGTIKKSWADIPVVVLTNVRNPETLEECKVLLGPSDRLLEKIACPPFELIDVIEVVLAAKAKR